MNSCCYGCKRRAVGCRTTCKEWQVEQSWREERRLSRQLERIGHYGFFDSARVNLVSIETARKGKLTCRL